MTLVWLLLVEMAAVLAMTEVTDLLVVTELLREVTPTFWGLAVTLFFGEAILSGEAALPVRVAALLVEEGTLL